MSTTRISAVPSGRLCGVSRGGARTIRHRAAQGPRAEAQRQTIPQDSKEERDARHDPLSHA